MNPFTCPFLVSCMVCEGPQEPAGKLDIDLAGPPDLGPRSLFEDRVFYPPRSQLLPTPGQAVAGYYQGVPSSACLSHTLGGVTRLWVWLDKISVSFEDLVFPIRLSPQPRERCVRIKPPRLLLRAEVWGWRETNTHTHTHSHPTHPRIPHEHAGTQWQWLLTNGGQSFNSVQL